MSQVNAGLSASSYLFSPYSLPAQLRDPKLAVPRAYCPIEFFYFGNPYARQPPLIVLGKGIPRFARPQIPKRLLQLSFLFAQSCFSDCGVKDPKSAFEELSVAIF